MNRKVENYDEKGRIETKYEAVTFEEIMDLIQKIGHGVCYHEETRNKWFNE